jgi:uncharacterized repeat protein (TIGR03837 family)
VKIKIDIFCDVIDNYGDIGFVYRLAKNLKKNISNSEIRVFLNKLEELKELAPSTKPNAEKQEVNNISFIDINSKTFRNIKPSNIIIEAYGCEIPDLYLQKINSKSIIINLEYLSAEEWTEGFHLKESLCANPLIEKYFFMPGFTKKTGGIIIDDNIQELSREFIKKLIPNINLNKKIIGSIFSYEHDFRPLIRDLNTIQNDYMLILCGAKTQQSFVPLINDYNKKQNYYKYKNIEFIFIDFLPQEQYDLLLKSTDFNFVRGEESLARAVLSKRPFLWHAYPQENSAHLEKVEAFSKIYTNFLKRKIDIEKYQNLIYNYSRRAENLSSFSEEITYLHFFENLKKYEVASIAFSDFLIVNCNLIHNLIDFIIDKDYLKSK